jgi:protoporphyrinogen/coproporphyrinogen III oxidase
MYKIAVIGGGITGLSTAYWLREKCNNHSLPLELTLIEGTSRLGGLLKSVSDDGFLMECGPDAFISEKKEALDLARRLGLQDHLIGTNPKFRRSFIVRKGRLHPVPEGFYLLAPSRLWPFINSGIISWPGKIRMLMDLIVPRTADCGSMQDETLASFVKRRLGREALERVAQPMVGGIYTADPEKLSLASTMPRFLEIEKRYRSLLYGLWKENKKNTVSHNASGARYSLFLSFTEGMEMLSKRLIERLADTEVLTDTQVLRVTRENEEWLVETRNQGILRFNAICMAVPAFTAAKLLKEVDSELHAHLDSIPYASTATINLAYKREHITHPLNGFGFVVPFVEKRSVMACTFSSVKFAGRAPKDHVLLRAFMGGALQPELFQMDEDQMIRAAAEDLAELLQIKHVPIFSFISKWPRSMAQYHLGHNQLVTKIRKRLILQPGLELAGNAYEGAGIPDCIKTAEKSAERIMDVLLHRPRLQT